MGVTVYAWEGRLEDFDIAVNGGRIDKWRLRVFEALEEQEWIIKVGEDHPHVSMILFADFTGSQGWRDWEEVRQATAALGANDISATYYAVRGHVVITSRTTPREQFSR